MPVSKVAGAWAGADETGADETGADETGADKTGADKTGADETGADETGADETGWAGSRSKSSGQLGTRSDQANGPSSPAGQPDRAGVDGRGPAWSRTERSVAARTDRNLDRTTSSSELLASRTGRT
jgi:hypothetical protein